MPGPGTVHLAVRVSPDGDTCVQSLPWNASAIVVSETMGDATYQVKPDEAVLFKGGHLKQASPTKQNCGCPKVVATQVAKAAATAGFGCNSRRLESPANTSAGAILPQRRSPAPRNRWRPAPPPEQHLSVDAPFIFHGNDAAPDLRQNVVMLKLENTKVVNLEPTVLPPPANKKKARNPDRAESSTANPPKESHGFFSKVGAFFASIFH